MTALTGADAGKYSPNEKASFLGKMTDGVIGILAADPITGDEARYGGLAIAAAALAAGSIWTRSRIKAYNKVSDLGPAPVAFIFG